ncbi:rhodanese-like domain-containing protein [Cyanobium sp. AMD-g]|uniref:rhodanese-like domain-containing protein n=1 Tax=Cyanobium sp. AMD-g TaxID=2823699 RepID=UPI0020CD3E66|nr:rhodanese-like domain-containing protein [Cyanobium sp. AMD-g]MCP9931159.1 rhodanese-like domain-containing protein [Cyanobium sp. AMD-g]
MKTSLSVALSGLLLAVLILTGWVSGAPAAAQGDPSLQGSLDQYLHSLPSDFHALRSVPALKELMADGNTMLIDVRQPGEFRGGHITGAINIPLKDLERHLGEIPPDKEIVLYCTTGYRSAMGVMALRLQGYAHVRGFPPSLAGWQAAGEPVAGGGVTASGRSQA